MARAADSHRTTRRPPGWLHFAAGGAGGMCGAIITSPLDVVKTRLQSDLYRNRPVVGAEQRGLLGVLVRGAMHFVDTGSLVVEIARREGVGALFKGLGPTLVGVVPARAINFYTYGNGKRIIADQCNHGAESPLVHLSAAAVAGVITATATNPIWVVKTRLQLESQQLEARSRAARESAIGTRGGGRASKRVRSLKPVAASVSMTELPRRTIATWSARRARFFQATPPPPHPTTNALQMTLKTLRHEGVAGLYKGLSASYVGVSESTIQWVLYERLKRFETPLADTPGRTPWLQTVSAAGTAKLVATVITYPHEVIRTRLRQQPEYGVPRYTGLVQTLRVILREEGVAALYGGLSAHLMRVIPNAIVTFSIYEFVIMLGSNW
ncbi:Pyrimidine nucleotide transporter, mitochondrial [Malassezia sp. CBS 17886]|nr:Pyrimidine nucleotide transporter, mitochondrial [Malassezia sp. CBS 17886]